MRQVDKVMRRIYEKGWFIHRQKWLGRCWIPVMVEYKDSVTDFYSGSWSCWEDPVESFREHRTYSLPTKWLPGLEKRETRISEWKRKKVA